MERIITCAVLVSCVMSCHVMSCQVWYDVTHDVMCAVCLASIHRFPHGLPCVDVGGTTLLCVASHREI